VEAVADLFVAVAGRGTRQRRAVEDFFVRPAHGFSFELKRESCKCGMKHDRSEPREKVLTRITRINTDSIQASARRFQSVPICEIRV